MAWRARIGQHVRELRIHYCQSSPTSEGLRCAATSARRVASHAQLPLRHRVGR
jgi:hypothetical protein